MRKSSNECLIQTWLKLYDCTDPKQRNVEIGIFVLHVLAPKLVKLCLNIDIQAQLVCKPGILVCSSTIGNAERA